MIHWTPEQDKQIQQMVNDGYSAARAAKVFECSKNAVIGRAFRLGLRFHSQRVIGVATQSVSARFSKEEDDRLQKLASDGLKGSEIAEILGRGRQAIYARCKLLGIDLAVTRGPKVQAPKATERQLFRVVSNNVDMMVEDWLRRNGGPRKFEARCSTDYGYLTYYLENHGVSLTLVKGHPHLKTRSGSARKVEWDEVYRTADKFRVAEGLEPILREVAA